jgi:hypothetical protein
MTLDAAHRGYDYQDLLTAIRFVDMLLGRLEVTHVDHNSLTAICWTILRRSTRNAGASACSSSIS